MGEFENKYIENFTYESRIIASWIIAGGKVTGGSNRKLFKEWLQSIGIGETDIDHILFLAENGKLEYQCNAREFLKNNKLSINTGEA